MTRKFGTLKNLATLVAGFSALLILPYAAHATYPTYGCTGFFENDDAYAPTTGNMDCVLNALATININHTNAIQTAERYYKQAGSLFAPDTTHIDPANIDICSENGYTCDLTPSARPVQVQCIGNNAQGGWTYPSLIEGVSNGQCWSNLRICHNPENGKEVCADISINGVTAFGDIPSSPQISDELFLNTSVNITPYQNSSTYPTTYSKCGFGSNVGTHRSDIHKEYCLWQGTEYTQEDGPYTQYTPTEGHFENDSAEDLAAMDKGTGFTGQTGDDMFAIARNSEGFLEYIDFGDDISNAYRLKHIVRDNNGENMDLMIPAGPRHTMKDYKDFINNPPPSATVTSACYPAQATVNCAIQGTYEYCPPWAW